MTFFRKYDNIVQSSQHCRLQSNRMSIQKSILYTLNTSETLLKNSCTWKDIQSTEEELGKPSLFQDGQGAFTSVKQSVGNEEDRGKPGVAASYKKICHKEHSAHQQALVGISRTSLGSFLSVAVIKKRSSLIGKNVTSKSQHFFAKYQQFNPLSLSGTGFSFGKKSGNRDSIFHSWTYADGDGMLLLKTEFDNLTMNRLFNDSKEPDDS